MGHSKTPSVSEQTVGRIPEPPETRNWKVNIYCIGVCFGALALGELVILDRTLYVIFQSKGSLCHSQGMMSPLWAAH